MRPDPQRSEEDPDGVRISRRREHRLTSARLLLAILVSAALAVVAGSTAAVWWLRHDPGPRVVTAATTERLAAAAVESGGSPPALVPRPDRPRRSAGPERRLASSEGTPERRQATVPPAERSHEPVAGPASDPTPTQRDREVEAMAQEVLADMKAAGATEGLAAFPPPGTKPIIPGLVVPEGFELPPGYVRHYQTTDDGKRLQAILMFSPDYELVDADGRPVPLPKDRIVPPEMAPPGLPVRTLVVPPSSGTATGAPRGGER